MAARNKTRLEDLNSWTPAQTAEWTGLPLGTVYHLLREELAPSIRVGGTQEQRWPNARTGKRKRSCFRYIIPAKAFRQWYEGISQPARAGATGSRAALTATTDVLA